MCRPMLEDRDDNNIGIYVIWEIHTLFHHVENRISIVKPKLERLSNRVTLVISEIIN